MQILFTAIALVVLIGCVLALTRSQREADRAEAYRDDAHKQSRRFADQADRVTVIERDLDALRRELRKLSGKFYATQHAAEVALDNDLRADAFFDRQRDAFPVCENWENAKLAGPRSEAASCECSYCVEQRRARAAEKQAILAKPRAPLTIVGAVDRGSGGE